jgi:folate-dependent phosphoribosylglycinamide formyltransferase PurN
MPRSQAPQQIGRIVVLSLDSLCACAAIPVLAERLPGRIVGICLSRRFGGKYGSVWAQAKRNYHRSGFSFVVYTSLQTLLFYPMSFIAQAIDRVRRRPSPIYPLRQLARRHGIPIFSTRDPNSHGVVERIRSLKPDLIIVCYFDRVVRSRVLEIPGCGVINIHPGLLPENRGPVPNVWAIINGSDQVGATVHYVDGETLDTGPILKFAAVARDPGASVLTLDCQLLRLGAHLAVEVIDEIENGTKHETPQDPNAGRYFSFPTRKDLQGFARRGGRLYRISDFVRQFFNPVEVAPVDNAVATPPRQKVK